MAVAELIARLDMDVSRFRSASLTAEASVDKITASVQRLRAVSPIVDQFGRTIESSGTFAKNSSAEFVRWGDSFGTAAARVNTGTRDLGLGFETSNSHLRRFAREGIADALSQIPVVGLALSRLAGVFQFIVGPIGLTVAAGAFLITQLRKMQDEASKTLVAITDLSEGIGTKFQATVVEVASIQAKSQGSVIGGIAADFHKAAIEADAELGRRLRASAEERDKVDRALFSSQTARNEARIKDENTILDATRDAENKKTVARAQANAEILRFDLEQQASALRTAAVRQDTVLQVRAIEAAAAHDRVGEIEIEEQRAITAANNERAARLQALGPAVSGVPATFGLEPTGHRLGGIIRAQHGLLVPGSGSGDHVPALLEPGELVVPKPLTRALVDLMGRPGPDVQAAGAIPPSVPGTGSGDQAAHADRAVRQQVLGPAVNGMPVPVGLEPAGHRLGGLIRAQHGTLVPGLGGGDHVQPSGAVPPSRAIVEVASHDLSGHRLGGVIRAQHGMLVPGTGSGDHVPALLEPGELVVPKSLTRALFDLMGRSGGPHFQTGGTVGPISPARSDEEAAIKSLTAALNVLVSGLSGGVFGKGNEIATQFRAITAPTSTPEGFAAATRAAPGAAPTTTLAPVRPPPPAGALASAFGPAAATGDQRVILINQEAEDRITLVKAIATAQRRRLEEELTNAEIALRHEVLQETLRANAEIVAGAHERAAAELSAQAERRGAVSTRVQAAQVAGGETVGAEQTAGASRVAAEQESLAAFQANQAARRDGYAADLAAFTASEQAKLQDYHRGLDLQYGATTEIQKRIQQAQDAGRDDEAIKLTAQLNQVNALRVQKATEVGGAIASKEQATADRVAALAVETEGREAASADRVVAIQTEAQDRILQAIEARAAKQVDQANRVATAEQGLQQARLSAQDAAASGEAEVLAARLQNAGQSRQAEEVLGQARIDSIARTLQAEISRHRTAIENAQRELAVQQEIAATDPNIERRQEAQTKIAELTDQIGTNEAQIAEAQARAATETEKQHVALERTADAQNRLHQEAVATTQAFAVQVSAARDLLTTQLAALQSIKDLRTQLSTVGEGAQFAFVQDPQLRQQIEDLRLKVVQASGEARITANDALQAFLTAHKDQLDADQAAFQIQQDLQALDDKRNQLLQQILDEQKKLNDAALTFRRTTAPGNIHRGGVIHAQSGFLVPGTGSGDIVPALLEPGELVVPREVTRGLVDAMARTGGHLATGGTVPHGPAAHRHAALIEVAHHRQRFAQGGPAHADRPPHLRMAEPPRDRIRAQHGLVSGPGATVPVLLEPGEAVIPPDLTQRLMAAMGRSGGAQFIHGGRIEPRAHMGPTAPTVVTLHQAAIPGFQHGGFVTSSVTSLQREVTIQRFQSGGVVQPVAPIQPTDLVDAITKGLRGALGELGRSTRPGPITVQLMVDKKELARAVVPASRTESRRGTL